MKNTLDIYEKNFQISTCIHTQWLRNNKNCFSETKILQMKQKLIIIRKYFFILPSKWNVYVIKHLNWEY